MKQEDFEKLLRHIQRETTELLVSKGKEYAGDADRLANFKRGAALTGAQPLTVLFIYMSKHYDALSTYVREAQVDAVLSEPITGRLADLINYCVLAWALIEEERGMVRKEKPVDPEVASTATSAGGPARIRLRSASGQTATAEGATAEKFMLLVNHSQGSDYITFEGTTITAWAFEGEQAWREIK